MSRDPVIYWRTDPTLTARTSQIWTAYQGVGGTDGVWAGMGIAASMGASTRDLASGVQLQLIAELSWKGPR